jgi:RecA/RadA recombinase
MLTPKKKAARHPIVEAVDAVFESESATRMEEDSITPGAEDAEPVKVVDTAAILASISKELKFTTFEPEEQFWLDTGSPQANSVFGTRELGIPYGRIIELSGVQHGGKTTLTTILAGLAQKEGAGIGYIDLEFSSDKDWAAKLGLNLDYTTIIKPKLIREKKGTIPRLQSAEELFSEAEIGIRLLSEQGFKKQFWMLDSIANLQTQMVVDAGTMGQNMRTNADRAQFLSKALPKWAGLAANYNAMIVLINQIRTKVGFVLGNPTYRPGGNALDHACQSRVEVKRMHKGTLLQNGRVVGLVGKIVNFKNKIGHGSVQSEMGGFMVKWNRPVAQVKFMSAEEAEALLKGEADE